MMDTVLSIEDLAAGYDHAAVVHGITLSVGAGEIVAVMGANVLRTDRDYRLAFISSGAVAATWMFSPPHVRSNTRAEASHDCDRSSGADASADL